MAHIDEMVRFVKENSDHRVNQISDPLMPRYIGFFAAHGQVLTVEENNNIQALAVIARSSMGLADFLYTYDKGWYFNDYLVYGEFAWVDYICIRLGIGKRKAKKTAYQIVAKIKEWSDKENIDSCLSARYTNNRMVVRQYYKKEASNGKMLWVCRTVGVSPARQESLSVA